MKEKDQENHPGAGWVLYWKGVERRRRSEGMGKLAEIYDAEMLVLLRGLETAIEFQQETPEVRQKIVKDRISRRRHVLERCDNERGPRTQPTNIDRGNCDDLPQREQKCKHGSIVGPRTHGNTRKRQSGRNSEGATELKPATETTTIAKLH